MAGMSELTATRHVPHPRERVFAALSQLDQLVKWWGPNGFTSTSEAFDFRPGGSWKMTMHGPDGASYPNLYLYHLIEAPARIVLEHPDPNHWFELTITCAEGPAGTDVTWHQRFTPEHFPEVRDFVAAANEEVRDRLAAVVATGHA